MPRSKVGVKRAKVDSEELNKAVSAVLSKDVSTRISLREAVQIYGGNGKNFSLKTLHRHVQKFQAADKEKFVYENNCDWKRIFDYEEEKQLVEYCIKLSQMKYGLSRVQFCKVVYKFATATKKRLPANWAKNEMAGIEWVNGFLRRNKELSVRKPESTSLSRSTSFNRSNVKKFFHNLIFVFEKYGRIEAADIYNVDETALTTVPEPPKVIAEKGQKQVGSKASGERGQLVTMIGGISALENHIPPYFIFPRVHLKDYMLHGAPAGSAGSAHPSGWSNKHIFLEYMEHFMKFANASKDKKILLILDNHESHMSLEVIDFARENGVILLTLPPHTSNRMQPLDVSVYGPFKTYFAQEVSLWLHNNPGKTFTIYNIAAASANAFQKAFSSSNIISGFRSSGICPLNPDIFTDADFLGSYVTDRPMSPASNELLIGPTSEFAPTTTSTMLESVPGNQSANTMHESPPDNLPITQESHSIDVCTAAGTSHQNQTEKSQKSISPEDVVPYPKASPRKQTRKGRKPGATKILTLTPDKPPDVANPNETSSKADKIQPGKRGKSKVPQPKSKRRLSFKISPSSSSSDISLADSDDDCDSESFSSDSEPEQQIESVDESKLQVGAFVVTKTMYQVKKNKSQPKYFIGRIEAVGSECFTVKFLRKKSKAFHFPNVDDILDDIKKNDIVGIVHSVNEKRGYYNFNFHWASMCE